MSGVDARDLLRHAPAEPDPYWQESFFIGWYDARRRCGGHHHISFCPYQSLAHVWSLISLDGRIIARRQENAVPMPTADLDDVTVGPLRFTAGPTARDLRLTIDGEAQLTIDYRALTDPTTLDFNTGGLQLGKGHYESMGRVRGALEVDGRRIELTGSAWQDHSWGPRKLSSHKSGRYFWAVFGEDLALSVYGIDDAGGQNRFGYVLDAGQMHPVESATFGVQVGDDGLSPRSLDARVYTTTGRGYHVTGTADANALVGGAGWADGGDFFGMNGLMRYACGGRLGEGLLEITELRTPLAHHIAELNLPGGD